jgi:hypothetical protein
VGTYDSNPNAGTQTASGGLLFRVSDNTANPVVPDGFFDVHVKGATLDDTAVVNFSYSGDISDIPLLGFFVPGDGWHQFQSSSLIASTFTVDPNTHIILKGEYQGKSYAGKFLDPTTLLVVDQTAHTLTAFFDSTSNPLVTQLHGTVFTVAVSGTTTTTTAPTRDVASASGDTSGASSTTTFVSSAQGTLVLSVSQVSQGTASQSAVAGPNRAGDSESGPEEDAWHWFLGGSWSPSSKGQADDKGKGRPADREEKAPDRGDAGKEKTESRKDSEAPELEKSRFGEDKEDSEEETRAGPDDAFLSALDFLFAADEEDGSQELVLLKTRRPVLEENLENEAGTGLDLRWALAATLVGVTRLPEVTEERTKKRRPLPAR